MNHLIILLFLFLSTAITSASIRAPAGIVDVDNGLIVINGEKQYVIRQSDKEKMPLQNMDLRIHKNRNPGLFLSIYWDSKSADLESTRRLIIIDATGNSIVRSNVLDSGLDFEWGDNNYAYLRDGVLYFGIFEPARKQFTYKNGVLSENTGPWAGPNKPEKYIVPDEKDQGPCFNVANVPECIAEQERDEAEKRSKSKPKKSGPPRAH